MAKNPILQKLIKKNPPVRRPMPSITPFAAGSLPSAAMDIFTTEINNLIAQYNKLDDTVEQIKILRAIQAKIKVVDYKYPATYFEGSRGYRTTHALLFKEIKYQYESLGVASLVAPEHNAPLSELIANMSPEAADKFIGVLSADEKGNLFSKLNKLYDRKDTSTEAEEFRHFLNTHEITFLGGGNSKNFKVTHLTDNKTYVLKIDNRLDMPRNAEAHLREKLGNDFAPIYAERQATYSDRMGRERTRSLLVTEYCTGGSVYEHRVSQRAIKTLAKNANSIFMQMATTLSAIEKAGCMFPDAKITNWLVDGNGKVRLADTKSFVFVDNSGQYKPGIPGNEYASLLRTTGFMPPEFNNGGTVSSGPVHSYIFGKNIHAYITGDVASGNNGADFNFKHAFYSTTIGIEYKSLITELVKPISAARLSVDSALEKLSALESLTELEALKFGAHDKKMDEFIANKIKELKTSTPPQRTQILTELKATVDALKADQAVTGVREMIQDFRGRAGLFTMGMNAKAARIEKSMGDIPIEDRCKFLKSKTSAEVMKAIASHRHLGKRGVTFFTDKGEIDLDRSANSYKFFTGKFTPPEATKQETSQPKPSF